MLKNKEYFSKKLSSSLVTDKNHVFVHSLAMCFVQSQWLWWKMKC